MKRKNTIIFLSLALLCMIMGCKEKGFYTLNKMESKLTPYIEDYIDKVGTKRENIDRKYLRAVVYGNHRGPFVIRVCFDNSLDHSPNRLPPLFFIKPIKGEKLFISNRALSLILEPDEESIAIYEKNSHYKENKRDKSLKDDGIKGCSDQLEIIVDSEGNVIAHKILFADKSEFNR